MRLSRTDFSLMKWLAWLAAFVVSSEGLVNFENIMNRTGLNLSQILYTGSKAGGSFVARVNLWNEGPGYILFGLIGISAFMWCKEFLSFQKSVTTLSHSDPRQVQTGHNLPLSKEVNV